MTVTDQYPSNIFVHWLNEKSYFDSALRFAEEVEKLTGKGFELRTDYPQ